MNKIWEIKIEEKFPDEIRIVASPTEAFLKEVGNKAYKLHRLLLQKEEEAILKSLPIESIKQLRKTINKVFKEHVTKNKIKQT